ncbi:uncharacterized protein LOC134279030 isoform X3 [Saccostrea cucullata]|uniref:uncharacterized protein LOC134279030 isoform X3 n=1 Tax=Saccostrea cuccullata TaxID=36930 RepID=UPI002ED26231
MLIVMRYRSRAPKEHILHKEPAGIGDLVTPSTEKGAGIAFDLAPLEYTMPSNVNKNDEAVYVESPDNIYDSTLIRRPHVFQQNNIYQTNEGIYNVTFAKRDHDINNDSNPYQSCE